MAKFRNGNLVLTSAQTIIHGSHTILDATRKGSFNSLELDSTSAVVITEFSTDTTLAGNSDASLPTEKAVKSYVDNGLAELSPNKISQLDSKVEVIDTGSDGRVTMYVDGIARLSLTNTPLLRLLGPIEAGQNGGGLGSTLLLGNYSDPDYGAIFGSMASSIGPMMGYCVKPNVASFGFLSANSANIPRSCIELQGDINFWTAPTQTVAIDSPITLNTVMTITNAGGLKITGTGKAPGCFYAGTTNPSASTRLNYDGYFHPTAVVTQALVATSHIWIQGTTKADAYLYAGTTDPTNTTRLNYDGYFYATRVYNAYLNDIADFQLLKDLPIAGVCYYDTLEGAMVCTERCQKSVMGILSDTYGLACGYREEIPNMGPFAVAGWVLAFVDDVCEPGDVLTNGSNGHLVKMTTEEKAAYPERIVAIYKKPEPAENWGPNNEIAVSGRHWVKVGR